MAGGGVKASGSGQAVVSLSAFAPVNQMVAYQKALTSKVRLARREGAGLAHILAVLRRAYEDFFYSHRHVGADQHTLCSRDDPTPETPKARRL
jgi:hypothetical protein